MDQDIPYLERQPNMADLISWVLALPAILLGVVACPYMNSVLSKFHPMFRMIKGELPLVTKISLAYGPWIFTVLPICIVIVILLVQIRSSSGIAKIASSFLGGQLILTIIGFGIAGIYTPVLELQKQLM